jgi:2-methylcitrate dehydratase
VVTSPEMASFANASMLRHCDYNDAAPGSHSSDIVPGILAIGEALHCTGSQVLMAVTLGVEVLAGLFQSEDPAAGWAHWDYKYEGVATALATGKLLGLNEDQLANALSIALVPQIPLFVPHIGALSHWKGCHGPWGTRSGVMAALLAQEGLTGPAQPFEERSGLWDNVTGPCKPLRLPVNSDRLMIDNMRFKRYPADGNTQAMIEQFIPAIKQFTNVDDIASIEVEMPFPTWQENADPPKWDPQNRETADHSIPYLIAVGLTDGEIYLDAFKPKRWEDASLRQIMNKVTCEANPEFVKPRSRVTVRTKAGKEQVTDVFVEHPVTHDEVVAKFKRVCAYKSISDEQRDRTLATWTALEKVHDIADTMRDLAHFGKPLPL